MIKRFIPLQILLIRREYLNRKWENYFKGKKIATIFEEIYRNRLWDDEKKLEFSSGRGSHEEYVVDKYVENIKKYFGKGPRLNAVDLGCGDFYVGKKIRPLFNNYIACDIVGKIIEYNKIKFKDDNVDFRRLDLSEDEIPQGEVLLVRQVLQHLDNHTILKFVENLKRTSFKYLVLTEHIPKGEFIPNVDKTTGFGIRLGHKEEKSGVVLTKSPFNFRPKNEEILCEALQMDGLVRTILYYLE